MAEPTADPDPEIELLLALVRQRYGAQLSAEQLDGVCQGVAGIVKLARALRPIRLDNADEPWPPFVPFRDTP
jgi:hypothetical protein